MTSFPEQQSREELRAMQLERLQALVSAVEESNPFWRAKLTAAGVSSADLQTWDDIRRLPFCLKQERRLFRGVFSF